MPSVTKLIHDKDKIRYYLREKNFDVRELGSKPNFSTDDICMNLRNLSTILSLVCKMEIILLICYGHYKN